MFDIRIGTFINSIMGPDPDYVTEYFSMCQYQNVTVVWLQYYNVTITWEYTYLSLVPSYPCSLCCSNICCFLNSVYLLRTDQNSNIIVLNYIVGGLIVRG